MLYMEDWKICAPDHYSLGFQGDHLATEIELSAPLPEGWDLKMDVEKDGKKNIIQLERNGDIFSARLTSAMLAEDGSYFMQVRGTNGDVVRHSNVFLAMVYHSVEAVQAFPSPLPSEFEQMERRLTALNQHPPKPGDGVWLVWNEEREQYEPSEISLSCGIVSQDITSLRVLDRAEYEALPSRDAGTLYFIRG